LLWKNPLPYRHAKSLMEADIRERVCQSQSTNFSMSPGSWTYILKPNSRYANCPIDFPSSALSTGRHPFLCRQEMCVSPQNAGVDDSRREFSSSCTVFGIVLPSSFGREIGYLNCFSSVRAKNRDFTLNIYHNRFLPHAFHFTIH
jgi:hypothetical protein